MNKNYKPFLSALLLTLASTASYGQALPVGGAAENTPSHSEYFSWINNTNEGPTERQTQINLDFFKWLHDTYGMQLDIYAFDAGALDGAKRYGSTRSKRFKQQFPNGLDAICRKASSIGTQFGVWCGPDGFGDTPEEAAERMDIMTELPPLLPEYLEPVRALFEKPRVKQAMKLLDDGAEAAMVMQCELCEIPAPTFHEEVRAAEIVRRMKALGLKDVHVDEIGNVIGRRPGRGDGPVLAIGAHMDTVFPEGTPIKVRREDDRYWAPGIADNCCGLRCLLETIRAFEETGVETEGDIWFVGTVGEEGNGDIRGSKHLFNGTNHIDGFLAVDNADMGRLLYAAIGSHRYRFTITGPGGHSWTNFSECPSAVHAMCLAGAKVAHVKVPEGPRTTFTIGTIKGGTSVNTIAASCQVDVDMRSLDDGNLAALEAMIFKCFEEGVAEENAIWGVTDPAKQVRLEVTMIGDRPGGQRPHDCPVLQTSRAAMDCLGLELKRYTCSSTDANKPVSLGIPATCLSGGGAMYRTHTVDEYYDAIHIEEGPKMVFLTACALTGAEGMKALLPKLPAA